MEERIKDLIEFVEDTLTIITLSTFNRFYDELVIIYSEFKFKLMLKDINLKLHSNILIYYKNTLVCVLTISKDFIVVKSDICMNGLDITHYMEENKMRITDPSIYTVTHWYNDKNVFLSYTDKMNLLLKLKDDINK